MDIIVKRGSNNAISNYIGQTGELLYNISNKRLSIGDGSTSGGIIIPNVDDIKPFQTSYTTKIYNNGNTWYRLYSDGFKVQSSYIENTGALSKNFSVSLLTSFQTNNYFVGLMKGITDEWTYSSYASNFMVWNRSVSSFYIRLCGSNDSISLGKCQWFAFGY